MRIFPALLKTNKNIANTEEPCSVAAMSGTILRAAMNAAISFLGLFSNVNDWIMPMSDAVLSENPKTMGIQQKSSALSITHRDLSIFSESFDDVMHCRWW